MVSFESFPVHCYPGAVQHVSDRSVSLLRLYFSVVPNRHRNAVRPLSQSSDVYRTGLCRVESSFKAAVQSKRSNRKTSGGLVPVRPLGPYISVSGLGKNVRSALYVIYKVTSIRSIWHGFRVCDRLLLWVSHCNFGDCSSGSLVGIGAECYSR